MPLFARRAFLSSATALAAAPVLAQPADPHAGHAPLYESLREPGRIDVPAIAAQQRVFDSPAPPAENPGSWTARAPLPVPRSEMAWATVLDGRMHLLGGYGEQRVDRPWHQVYDPASDAWSDAPPLPRGANHVGVATLDGRLYAIGGHLEQNRRPDALCFVLDRGQWTGIAPLPRATGAIACIDFEGRIHAVGGAIGDTGDTEESVGWHWALDPAADRWEERAPLPTGRDHTGIVAAGSRIHVLGGRVDNFHTNSNLHHSYETAEDRWRFRNPLPTARSGHGAVVMAGRIFCIGGEGTNRVFAQNEAYDLQADRWEAFAPMMTPRHGLGAVAIGEVIYVAGGGPVMGGGVQSAVHESFELG